MKVLIFMLLIALTCNSFANQRLNSDDSNKLHLLAKNPVWLKLLGYEKQNKSDIKNPKFFISSSGFTNTYDELVATLAAFSEKSFIPDQSAQCRYPARYLWLESQLDFKKMGIEPVTCPEYEAFIKESNIQSISLIFATGYLGNPASYYGHLLVKINSDYQGTTDLENKAVNFGANMPPDENMMLYIFKGIFGGYQSSFTQQEYFYHAHNYGESELRDLWEYQLNLSPEKLQLLGAHLWELILQAKYTYYFFNRNCAYRVGGLLELIVDQHLVFPMRPWETPQAIMQRLQKTKIDNQPIVGKVIYHPSRQSKLYQRYKKLNHDERKVIHQITQTLDGSDSNLFNSQPISSQYKIVDTLIDYYQFVRKEDKKDKDPNNELYRKALNKRFQLPPFEGENNFSSSNQPHLGRGPSYINIGNININGENTVDIWLRPAYYDSLDSEYGHIKNAALSMAELRLGINDRDFYIREFNLIKIESLRRNFTKLPGDNHASWYLEAGAEEINLNCEDCLASKINAGYGYAASLFNDTVLVAGYAGSGFLGKSIDQTNLFLSTRSTLNINLNDNWRILVENEIRRFEDNEIMFAAFNIRKKLSAQTDLRLYYQQQEEKSEMGLSVGLYW